MKKVSASKMLAFFLLKNPRRGRPMCLQYKQEFRSNSSELFF